MTVIKARKERQRLERENLILENAARLLARDGFQDLNLDELAAAVEYSKGTLYLHFKTKEDLVLAAATQALRQRTELLEHAATFLGTTRERARAMGFACCEFAEANRDFFTLELMLQARSFWNRVSVDRKKKHLDETRRVYETVLRVVCDARACGDLPQEISVEDVSLSLMAITLGSHSLVAQPKVQELFNIKNPLSVLLMHQDRMLDGWGWKPLSNGSRYLALDRRIHKELFPEATWFKF